MSYVVLARKWRPMRFSDLVGQDHVARTLGNAIDSGRVAHAFLFTGVRGVGKTTSARILAKALNCMGDPETRAPGSPDPGPTVEPCLRCSACLEITEGRDVDVQEIDGASYNGVDEVRKLQDSLPYRPSRDRYKIVIVDEVHMLTQAAWNAFLKTLEEPPPHVKFIFATTEVHKVPITILSRVQRFDFKMIPARLIMDRLRWVLEQEKSSADEEALSILARQAAGSMRDAMSLLDQVIAFSGESLRGEDVAQVLGVASRGALLEIAESLVKKDAETCLRRVSGLADQGFDIPKVTRDLLSLLRDLVVARICQDAKDLLDSPDEERAEITRIARSVSDMDLMRLHAAFSKGFDDVVRGADPRSGLEMLLVRLAGRPDLLPVDELLHRIAHLEKRLTTGVTSRPRPQRSPAGLAPAETHQPRRPRERSPGSPKSDSAPSDGDEEPHAASNAPLSTEPVEAPHPTEAPDLAAVAPSAFVFADSEKVAAERALASPAGSVAPAVASTPALTMLSEHAAPARPPSQTPPPAPAAEDVSRPALPTTPPKSEEGAARNLSSTPPTRVRFAPTEEQARLLAQMAEVGQRLAATDVELAAYFDHLVPLAADGVLLRLGMERGLLFASQLSTPEAKAKIGEAVRQVWGPEAAFELIPNCPDADPERSLSAQKARERAARYQAAIDEVRNHPRVIEACRIFGAQIKNVVVAE